MGVLAMLTGFSFHSLALDDAQREHLRQFKEQKDAIYAHMRRYGINREDVAALGRLGRPPHHPHVKLASEDLYNPGEHYRVEMDEYILTMKVPDLKGPMGGGWIWPYTNTRSPDLKMQRFLDQSKGTVSLLSVAWYVSGNLLPSWLVEDRNSMGVSIHYQIVEPEAREKNSTPEKMRQTSAARQKTRVLSKEEIDRDIREGLIDNRTGNRIVLTPEPVVINGRIWIREAMVDSGYDKRRYQYVTYLRPDRILIVNAGLPRYDYDAHPDPSTYPDWIKKALVQHEAMIASLRIAKVNDDGSPDPFVVERIEPAPLPVREKLPVAE
jgi:hypothetical protein